MDSSSVLIGLGSDTVLGLADASVLVVGDVMIDRYLAGTVERVSPEAPIPVVLTESERSVLGGAANVAANIAALGASVTLAGQFGHDDAGDALGDLCALSGVDLLDVLRSPEHITIEKLRIVGGRQQIVRIDRERPAAVSDQARAHLVDVTASYLARHAHSVLILSDYAKGTLDRSLVQQLIAVARAAGRPVVVDPKSADLTMYDGATVIKPNRGEALRAAGPGDTSPAAVAERIVSRVDVEHLVVSLAEQGVFVRSRDGQSHLIPSRVAEVADVSGAGDSMVAGIATALAVGYSIERAVALGNLAAGVACTRLGTAIVDAADLVHAIELSAGPADAPHVVRDLDTLRRAVALEQRAGRTVVFANGVFDLLHAGHVRLLEEARRQGDVLVVAINSDASTKRLKGPSRPLQPEDDRLSVLAAVRFVDYVTTFEQDTPLEAILALRPDVIVKGSDYSTSDVVGGAEAAEWGGRVHLVDLLSGVSTTRLAGGQARAL